MSPEKQRIVIAEACGWHGISVNGLGVNGMLGPLRGFMPVPEYLHDLNAMAEAEAHLTELQKTLYADALAKLVEVYDDYYDGITFQEASKLIYATAAQKAECFLIAIGKWGEG